MKTSQDEVVAVPDVVTVPDQDERWADEGGAMRSVVLADVDGASDVDGVGDVDASYDTAFTRAAAMAPLLGPATVEGFLSRWTEIQVGFVEDPRRAVRDADALIGEITGALAAAADQRRAFLATRHGVGDTGTEELRLALRRYRSFLGVLLPKTTTREGDHDGVPERVPDPGRETGNG